MLERLARLSLMLNRLLAAIAGVVLVGMMALACANVGLRFCGYPLKGTFEMMGFLGAIVAAFALGKTQISREHIAVDVLVRLFPPRLRRLAGSVNDLIGMLFFIIAAWQSARWGLNLQRVHEVSETLRIVSYPFVYGVALGCVMIALVFLVDLLKTALSSRKADT